MKKLLYFSHPNQCPGLCRVTDQGNNRHSLNEVAQNEKKTHIIFVFRSRSFH